MEKDLVSVIIPTFNRFEYLLNTIESVKNQTYKNFEIIVVNDKSSQTEYYNYDWDSNNIKIIHLDKNSKQIFGFACAGHVRNKGIEKSSGKYIAFCDDDDIWFPKKIELQIIAIENSGCKMCSTDGLIGNGVYNKNIKYKKFNAEQNYITLQNIYRKKNSNLLENGFPKIWTFDFLKIHNCIICSSVLIEKNILDKINNFQLVKNGQEDYSCWLRALQHTNSIYIDDICFYYDNNHGKGRNY
jgi:glycosyltransferase involved in cell wall biosynthesis